MSFYPMFIPIMSSGGGGSPKEFLGILGVLGIIAGGCIYKLDRDTTGRIDLSVKQHKYHPDEFINVNTKEYRHPKVYKRISHNTDCLLQKGYRINNENKHKVMSFKTYNICSINRFEDGKTSTISKEQFLEDCKACNVYTEVVYSYNNLLGNKKVAHKKLMWHKNFEERLH